MRKYKLKELRDLVRLGVAGDYTNKPVEDTETGQLYAIIGRCSNLFILF